MSAWDEQFMSLALDLAACGRGSVEPNPMVGAVVVRDGLELGRGWHRRFGGPHAEIEAIAAAEKAGADVRGACLYVTLEPCCHLGKTPPCTDAIVKAGIARVVVAMPDPDEHAAGRGIDILRNAGLQVDVGLCLRRAGELLAGYVKLRTRTMPWVICKWAQTADGYLAMPPGHGRWISGDQARDHVQWIRGVCNGVCVGIETVLADDPLLTNRSGRGKRPARIVLDSRLRLPPGCRLVQTADEAPLMVATSVAEPAAAERLARCGIEVLRLPAGGGGVDLPALLAELGRREWTYLLVEGGATVLGSFIFSGLADELLAFVAPGRLGSGAGNLPRFDAAEVRRRLGLGQPHRQRFGPDELLIWKPGLAGGRSA